METLILICLLLIIVLLLKDKAVINQATDKQKNLPLGSPKLPSIMGQSKQLSNRFVQKKALPQKANNFDIDNNDEEDDIEIPQEDLDNVFSDEPDLEDEEKEWKTSAAHNSENAFATGVSFDELSIVSSVIQEDIVAPSLQKQAAGIVQKIQGTELFGLLENNVKDASKKIAALLDKSFNEQTNTTLLQNKDAESFDIGEFGSERF
jgi:hypothetical protein